MSDKIFEYEPLWGSWKIDKLIGEGRYGKVYKIMKGQNSYLSKDIEAAVKIITIPTSEQYLQADQLGIVNKEKYFEAELGRLIKEIENMNSLKGNSNIVSFEDYEVKKYPNKAKWDILIRMEYLTPLNKYRKDNKINTEDILKLGIDICKALETCLKQSIVHRDIKEENIFVNNLRDFKLGDFGISKEISKTGRAASYRGTPYYMAPEVFRGWDYNHTVDIYSLGIVLYKLLNRNRFPYMPDHTKAVSIDDLDNSFDKRINNEYGLIPPHDADEETGKIILKMIAYDSKDRYQDPYSIRKAFEKIINDLEKSENIIEEDVYTNDLLEDNVSEKGKTIGLSYDDNRGKTLGMYDVLDVDSSKEKDEYNDNKKYIDELEEIENDSDLEKDKTIGIFSEIDKNEEIGFLDGVQEDKSKNSKKKILLFIVALAIFSVVAVFGVDILSKKSPELLSENNEQVLEVKPLETLNEQTEILIEKDEDKTEIESKENEKEIETEINININEEFKMTVGDDVILADYFETNAPIESNITYEIVSGGGTISEGIYNADTVGILEIRIAIDDVEAILKGEVEERYISQITTNVKQIILQKDETSSFNYDIKPIDATKKNISIWTDNSGTISIVSNKMIKANKPGTGYVYIKDKYSDKRAVIKVRVPIVFIDDNFKKAIKNKINATGDDIFVEDVNNIEALILRDLNIISVYGIKYFNNLSVIRMDNNNMYVVGELVDLPKLKYLDLRNNNIRRTDIFKGFKNLETLKLYGNPVYDEKEAIETIVGFKIE